MTERKSLYKEFAGYVSLNVLGMLGLSCYILADTFFVSLGLGTDGLAALNLAVPVYSFIHGSGLMLGMGGASSYAIFRGAGNERAAGGVFTDTLYAAAVFAAVFVLAGAAFSRPITAALGADDAVFAMTETYLRVILLFAPAFILNNVVLCFVRNDGAPKLAMAAMLAGSLSNIFLDWLFMFPFGMGIFGAVFATGLAPLISLAVLSAHFFRRRNGFRPVRKSPDLRAVGRNLSLGFPSLVTEASSGIVMIAFNAILLRLEGNIGVAAYGIIANISLVVLSLYTGIAQGIQPIVGRARGAGDSRTAGQVFRMALLLMLAVSAAVYLVVFFCAGPVSDIFNPAGDAHLTAIAIPGLRLYFIATPFAGFNIIASMFFTASGRPLPAHIVSLLRGFIVILPAAFLLSALGGITGVWLAFPATEALVALVCVVLFLVYRRRTAVQQAPDVRRDA